MPVRRSFFFIFGMIALVALVFGVYFPVLTRYRNLKLEEEALDARITELDKKIKVLSEERELLKNDRDYIEKVIRQELGLVKPGEIVYKFVTEPIKKKIEEQKIKSVDTVAEEPISGISGTAPVSTVDSEPAASVKSAPVKKAA